jgi:hypothetical protein
MRSQEETQPVFVDTRAWQEAFFVPIKLPRREIPFLGVTYDVLIRLQPDPATYLPFLPSFQ